MHPYPPGTRIGPYEIASRPLHGGMGVVYFCIDHAHPERPVALKTFLPQFLPDRAARDRFLREGTAWVELGYHPHIVRCYKVTYEDPVAYLALELIAKDSGMDNASLRPWLGQPMPLARALLFALQIARGLEYASAKIPGFVHRDLKPENVLVGADRLPRTDVNRLRVTDFGLAAVLAERRDAAPDEPPASPAELGRTQLTRGAVGTPYYMAPEQWQSQPVGAYTDIYALGCILFEMLTGKLAAHGRSWGELKAVHCEGRLRPLPGDLLAGPRALLARCLALRPEDRFTAWGQLTRALEAAYAALGVGPVPPVELLQVESAEERQQAGRSFNEMGRAYLDLGKAAVAVSYFERALTIAREIGDRWDEGAALNHLGLAYSHLGDSRRAIGSYEQALAIDREIGDQRGVGADLSNLGIAYARLGDPRRAIGYYEQHLSIARKIGDRRGEGKALGNLGEAYLYLGDPRRAIGYYEQYLSIAREIGDRRGEGEALGSLGSAYKDLGDPRRAIWYCEQGLEIDREIGNRRGEGADLGNLGGAYLYLGDLRQAIGYLEQQLEITREIGDRHGEGTALGNLGNAYLMLGGPRRAIEAYEQALAIRREIGDLSGVALDTFNMAILYRQQNDPVRALPLAREAAQAFARIGHTEYARRAQELVAQLGGGEAPPPDPAQAAFEAFQRANSPQAMHAAVEQHPLLKEAGFVAAIERVIAEQVPPEQRAGFEQRLAWLRQVGGD